MTNANVYWLDFWKWAVALNRRKMDNGSSLLVRHQNEMIFSDRYCYLVLYGYWCNVKMSKNNCSSNSRHFNIGSDKGSQCDGGFDLEADRSSNKTTTTTTTTTVRMMGGPKASHVFCINMWICANCTIDIYATVLFNQ